MHLYSSGLSLFFYVNKSSERKKKNDLHTPHRILFKLYILFIFKTTHIQAKDQFNLNRLRVVGIAKVDVDTRHRHPTVRVSVRTHALDEFYM